MDTNSETKPKNSLSAASQINLLESDIIRNIFETGIIVDKINTLVFECFQLFYFFRRKTINVMI